MNLNDEFERLECRKDDKARRVLNAAPDSLAGITAEELENGVTIEKLESLTVPVFRYATQITIHGIVSDFNDSARVCGYRSVFRNGNGSIGVRYSAIDAAKKELILRACNVARGSWQAIRNASGFEVSRTFYVRSEEERAAQKAAVIECAKSIPVSRFFGGAGAYALPYGSGYAVSAGIGAIPQSELWPLIEFFSGISSEAQLMEMEARREAELDVKRKQWEIEAEERARIAAEEKAKSQAALAEHLKTVSGKRLSAIERKPGSFSRYTAKQENGKWHCHLVEIAKRGPALCYRAGPYEKWRKVEEFKWKAWNEAAQRGEIFAP